ncbi:MAG: helix-turn-helix domain-containing protein [Defluviitaleaceae bacterium]|nr:helix-turn-helix domain-containing protein [Defluviitaleaceae bacterium]
MITIGSLIKNTRKMRGFSQEALSFGICSTGNLSRIERGDSAPSRATFEALMERMGQNAELYPSFITDTDKRVYELQHDLNELYAKGDFDAAEAVIDEMDGIDGLDMVHEHFIRVSRVLLIQQRGGVSEEVLRKFKEIIDFFVEKFSLDEIRRTPLSKTELNILNAYAIALYKAGDVKTGTQILYELIKWIEIHVVDMESITVVYTKILYNLSMYVGRSGDDIEAIRLCDIGIRLCIKYHRNTYFPALLFNKGYGLVNLGKTDEAINYIQDSYYMQRALGEETPGGLEVIKNFADRKGIKLI